MGQTDLLELLEYIDPACLDYQSWVNVGMALKEEGYSAADWERWSCQDGARYHRGECTRKWDSFNGSGTPVTGGTIVQMAMERGWRPKGSGHELEWNDIISTDDGAIIDRNWIEGKEISEPDDGWDPKKDLITYLETLFEASETIGYVTHSFEKDGKHMPSRGYMTRQPVSCCRSSTNMMTSGMRLATTTRRQVHG